VNKVKNNITSNSGFTEGIKQQISLEMENAKFYQAFFIPTVSGLFALLFNYEKIGLTLAIIFEGTGMILLYWFYLRRKGAIKNINELIEKLKS
jgi:hypothetical protein